MATSTLKNVRFAGMASCVPKRIVSNLTDCKPQIRAERERLVRNIGIETRRMAPEWQCFSDLAFEATEKLLASADPSMPLGARLYMDNCVGCHFANGRGASEIFPALDGNAMVNGASATGLIHTILYGAELPSTEERPARLRMQGYDWRLNDEEVAALATFVRQGWHNQASEVSADAVAAVRANTANAN